MGEVPEHLLKQVTGEVVMAECQAYVIPLKKYPVEDVNDNSKRLCQVGWREESELSLPLQIHIQKCVGQAKILQQRHLLEAIPCAEIQYSLGSKHGKFWVYGQERYCYVPKYPSKCSIL